MGKEILTFGDIEIEKKKYFSNYKRNKWLIILMFLTS